MSSTIPIYHNKVRLNKSQDVQKLLARTANMLIDAEISDAKARTIGYLCQINRLKDEYKKYKKTLEVLSLIERQYARLIKSILSSKALHEVQ